MTVKECIHKGIFYLDGGTGSSLQARGLQPGELPELWNLAPHIGAIQEQLTGDECSSGSAERGYRSDYRRFGRGEEQCTLYAGDSCR